MAGLFPGSMFDFSSPAVQALVDLLASNLDDQDDIKQLAKDAGMLTGRLSFKLAPALLWPKVLEAAFNQERWSALLAQVKKVGGAKIAKAVDSLVSDEPTLPAQPRNEPSGGGWRGGDEALLGPKSTLLDIEFLALGLRASKAVCKLAVRKSAGPKRYGSAFLVGADLLLTNHHVLFDATREDAPPAVEALATFLFENGEEPVSVPCRAETIRGNPKHDCAVVRLSAAPPEGISPLRLGSTQPIEVGDPIFIVQHPGGGPKKIGLYRNEIRYVDDDVVQYLTDTMAGSSGSPAMNAAWEVVALHHRWLEAPDPPREPRNEGIRIDRVVEWLAQAGLSNQHP